MTTAPKTEDETKMCACGRPLHYTDPGKQRMVEELISTLGQENVIVVTSDKRRYSIPRHYIALHGLAEKDVALIAARYNFKQIEEPDLRRDGKPRKRNKPVNKTSAF